jgi:hypothetical protein
VLSKNIEIEINRTAILPVVLYGCESWSLTLRERHTLRVFENRVMRRIFGPKRYEETGEWIGLPNEELNDLYCSPNNIRMIQSRRTGWAGHLARRGERSGAYRVLVGKPEGKRPLGRPRCSLQEVGGVSWTGFTWLRIGIVMNAVMNLQVT